MTTVPCPVCMLLMPVVAADDLRLTVKCDYHGKGVYTRRKEQDDGTQRPSEDPDESGVAQG